MRSRLRGGATLVLGLWCTLASAAAPEPSPRLDPAAVVRIQLKALAHNDVPTRDAGIAVVWRFASPGNQSQTGPLPRFTRMIREGYGEMLDHRSAKLAAVVIQDRQALQGVDLIDRSGISHRYIFILSRQTEPPYRDCWMTDAVVGSPDEASQQSVHL